MSKALTLWPHLPYFQSMAVVPQAAATYKVELYCSTCGQNVEVLHVDIKGVYCAAGTGSPDLDDANNMGGFVFLIPDAQDVSLQAHTNW